MKDIEYEEIIESYREIYELIQATISVKWNKILFYAALSSGTYVMKYYVDLGVNQFVDCYSLPNADRKAIRKVFMSIYKIIRTFRENLPEEKKWSVMTLQINSDGKFKTDYDYEDISHSIQNKISEWEKKYLS